MTHQQYPGNADPGAAPHGEQDAATGLTPEPDIENDPGATRVPDGNESYADPGTSTADSVSTTDELQAELDQAQAEAGQYRDQVTRLQAEMENVRKRARRDVESARKFGMEKFAANLLEVRDSLEMGLATANEPEADFSQFYEGMELTWRNLAASMEKAGIEVINPEGETFDPERHEAVTAQPTSEYPPNTVMTVVQKGYLLSERVLRAAKVVVAKAPESAE